VADTTPWRGRRAWALAVLWLAAGHVHASELEIEAAFGRALATYTETYTYFPRVSGLEVPGLRLEQRGGFQIDARGSTAWSAAATFYFVDAVGLEARLDSAQVDLELVDVFFDVTATLPPLPPVSHHVDLPAGVVRVDDLRTLSLNLKFRTGGPVVLSLSGGVSRLGELDAVATQPMGLGVEGITNGDLDISTLALRATTESAPTDSGKLGANVGAGVRIRVGPKLALLAEARGFVFKKRRLVWAAAEAPGSPLEEDLLEEVLRSLPATELTPAYWRVAAGLSLTF
jgi:hypothetical protein